VWLPHQPGEDEVAWSRAFFSAVQPHQVGAYVNFLDRDDADRVPAAYGDATWRRLVALKDRFDPDNVFRLILGPPLRLWSAAASDYERGPLTWENGACLSCRFPHQEGTFSMQSSHSLDQLDIALTTPTPSPTRACYCLPRWPSGWASSKPPMRSSTWASGPAPPIPAASC